MRRDAEKEEASKFIILPRMKFGDFIEMKKPEISFRKQLKYMKQAKNPFATTTVGFFFIVEISRGLTRISRIDTNFGRGF